MNKGEFNERQIIIGFKTVILGLCLYIVELLFLPIFGHFQKLQVSAQGFQSNFIEYASYQPYPLIFILTGIIVIIGIAFITLGYREMKSKP